MIPGARTLGELTFIVMVPVLATIVVGLMLCVIDRYW